MNNLYIMTDYEMKVRLENYICYKNTTIYISSFMIDIQIFLEKKKISIRIPKNIIWEEILRRIDIQINHEKIQDCPICEIQHDNPIKSLVSCNKCAKYWCKSCYIELIKTNIDNKTILSCPFCLFCFQGEIPVIITQK